MKNKKFNVIFNAPVILIFTIICITALVLDFVTGGFTTQKIFSVYRSSLTSPFTYVRLICHVFGHANYAHFMGNITLFLIIGTLLEDKYGSFNIASIIFVTAIITGIINMIVFPDIMLLGASGVVFAFIILSSFSGTKTEGIPLTFIIVAVIYIGGQIYEGFFIDDNISNLSHIIGGLIGGGFGYFLNKKDKSIKRWKL